MFDHCVWILEFDVPVAGDSIRQLQGPPDHPGSESTERGICRGSGHRGVDPPSWPEVALYNLLADFRLAFVP